MKNKSNFLMIGVLMLAAAITFAPSYAAAQSADMDSASDTEETRRAFDVKVTVIDKNGDKVDVKRVVGLDEMTNDQLKVVRTSLQKHLISALQEAIQDLRQ